VHEGRVRIASRGDGEKKKKKERRREKAFISGRGGRGWRSTGEECSGAQRGESERRFGGPSRRMKQRGDLVESRDRDGRGGARIYGKDIGAERKRKYFGGGRSEKEGRDGFVLSNWCRKEINSLGGEKK